MFVPGFLSGNRLSDDVFFSAAEEVVLLGMLTSAALEPDCEFPLEDAAPEDKLDILGFGFFGASWEALGFEGIFSDESASVGLCGAATLGVAGVFWPTMAPGLVEASWAAIGSDVLGMLGAELEDECCSGFFLGYPW